MSDPVMDEGMLERLSDRVAGVRTDIFCSDTEQVTPLAQQFICLALDSLAQAVGEPPLQPDVMTNVRVLADVPAPERPVVSLPDRSAMAELIARIRSSRGADFSVCDVEVPARIGMPALPQDRRD